MIDFKWENGMYTIVENESQWNEVVESMKACGFCKYTLEVFRTDYTYHYLELVDGFIWYFSDKHALERDSLYFDLDELEKSSQSKPYFHSTDFTVELVPPFWDGEGSPEVGMMVDVEETTEFPSNFFRNVELKYSSEHNVVFLTGAKEVHLGRYLVVFHKPTVESTPLEKLQEWCTNNQRALGVDHLLEEMLKQELIDLSMLNQVAGD